jgi:anaerobic selenocysteine-containing dehydrogenase
VPFADRRFPTPSGRVELASEAAAADGHGRLPRPHADARPDSGRLRLLSPASPWALNASFSNDRKVARRAGRQELALTAVDAEACGLAEGDLARLTSEAGELVVPVRITADLPVGVGLLPKGRWPKLERGGANVNALTLNRPSDMGASTTVHGLEVSVTAVRERVPA